MYIERFAEQRAAGPAEAGEEQESGGDVRGEPVGGDARRMGPALSFCLECLAAVWRLVGLESGRRARLLQAAPHHVPTEQTLEWRQVARGEKVRATHERHRYS